MKLPVRKCFHAAKLVLFIILVVSILALFEQWRGGKRLARAQDSYPDDEFEREILEDEARIIPGLGEGGVAAHLIGEAKRLGEESEKKLAINVYLSDRIAYNRTLKDYRNPACERVVYDAELPSASVIIIFHNEPYSVVIRTIWSVLNSAKRNQPWYKKANFVNSETGRTMTLGYPGQDPTSPYVYLKEIILVDDNSTLPELKGKLSHYVRTRLPPDLVRILRLPDRQGLMRARIRGARAARGGVLVFLDAHCEVGADWLRPLLQRIRHKRDVAATPLIDVLDQTTFQLDAAQQFQVGGFTFMGHFTWIDVPDREKKRRGSDISPTWSPTMAGGLFAIDRAYYWEVGAYDEQMAGWGGENLEMSFRIWQCGGTLETIPCSRVGHVFRSFHPYGLPAHTDTHGINTARMAEVWMDDYAELFYLHRPDLRKNPKIGDVTHRRVLREKLKCKSFQWYLDNVYKEKFVPVRDVYGFGRFMNPTSGLCLDTLQREGEAMPLGLYPCHERLEATQYLALSLRGELRDEEKCAEVQYTRSQAGEVGDELTRRVLMVTCHGKQRGQKWRYLPTEQLQHAESRLCLTSEAGAGSDALVTKCRNTPRQIWKVDYSELNDFRMRNDIEPSEQELKLQRLRGQRRISRSLLSYPEEETNVTRRHHRKRNKKHKHKRNKKNKFILKLIRHNNDMDEEHLEVDVYCKHKQLFPNNSFVRDLVTVLNEKDIKVINNGRVFEHNKVTQLAQHARSPSDDLAAPTAPASLAPPQLRPLKKRKDKAGSLRPIDADMADTLEAADAVHGANVADDADQSDKSYTRNNVEPLDKKIIIEDFVELKPKTSTTKRTPKKRKRMRPRGKSKFAHKHTTTLSTPRSEWIDSVPVGEYSSREGGAKRPHARDRTRPVQESRFRRNDTHVFRQTEAHSKRRDNDVVPTLHDGRSSGNEIGEEGRQSDGDRNRASPVKVVMRSNLTFNLGDEFFRWQKRTADDVANLVGELMIPANTTLSNPPNSVELEDEKSVRHMPTDTDTDYDEKKITYRVENSDKEFHKQLASDNEYKHKQNEIESERDNDSDKQISRLEEENAKEGDRYDSTRRISIMDESSGSSESNDE